jgi:hypothetical protein
VIAIRIAANTAQSLTTFFGREAATLQALIDAFFQIQNLPSQGFQIAIVAPQEIVDKALGLPRSDTGEAAETLGELFDHRTHNSYQFCNLQFTLKTENW